MANRDWWKDATVETNLLSRLPEYRLSKFQPCLPERYALDMIQNYLLDTRQTVEWLAGVKVRSC
jgi:ATP-dependent Lhr-like helicase